MSVNKRLQITAASQHGYFTARQAVEAGYDTSLQNYHLRTTDWQRVGRALFRLNGYPDTIESLFTRWSLWAAGQSPARVVAISHESALYYYKLTPDCPEKVHLCVSSLKPNADSADCCLHLEPLEWGQYTQKQGFCLTTPLKTLLDMKPELLLRQQWKDTVLLAQENALLSLEQSAMLLADGRSHKQATGEEPLLASSGVVAYGQFSLVNRERANMFRVSQQMHSCRQVASGYRMPNRSFTLIEMLVVVAIICILAGLLMPSLLKAVDATRGVSCCNNLRQLAFTLPMYAEANAGYLPTPRLEPGGLQWWWLTRTYDPYTDLGRSLSRVQLFMCPSWNGGYMTNTTNDLWIAGTCWSYSLSYPYCGGNQDKSIKYSYINRYPNVLLLLDNRPQSSTSSQTWNCIASTPSAPNTTNVINLMTGAEPSAWRHNGYQASMLFGDFHAELSAPGDLMNANVAPPTQP